MAKTQKKAKTAARAAAKSRPKGSVSRAQRATPQPQPASRGKLERARMPAQAPKVRLEAPPSQDEGKYVYCIIKSDEPLSFGALGIGSEPAHVQTVNYRDLAAVVSSTSLVVQDPTRDNVLAHQRVNETVMQQHTVIPAASRASSTSARMPSAQANASSTIAAIRSTREVACVAAMNPIATASAIQGQSAAR